MSALAISEQACINRSFSGGSLDLPERFWCEGGGIVIVAVVIVGWKFRSLGAQKKRNFICDVAIRFINFDRVGYLT